MANRVTLGRASPAWRLSTYRICRGSRGVRCGDAAASDAVLIVRAEPEPSSRRTAGAPPFPKGSFLSGRFRRLRPVRTDPGKAAGHCPGTAWRRRQPARLSACVRALCPPTTPTPRTGADRPAAYPPENAKRRKQPARLSASVRRASEGARNLPGREEPSGKGEGECPTYAPGAGVIRYVPNTSPK